MIGVAIAGWLLLAVIMIGVTVELPREAEAMRIEMKMGRDGKLELWVDSRASKVVQGMLTRASPQGTEEVEDLRVVVYRAEPAPPAQPPHRPISDPSIDQDLDR